MPRREAPAHAFLCPQREAQLDKQEGHWRRRRGPVALSRAWCLFEIATWVARAGADKLHVALSAADRARLPALLEEGFDEMDQTFAGLDARDAQLGRPLDGGEWTVHGLE